MWAHNANIMLEQNLRAQQKYNKFTVHGELKVLVSKLYVKFMNAVLCFKAISCAMSMHTASIQPARIQKCMTHLCITANNVER